MRDAQGNMKLEKHLAASGIAIATFDLFKAYFLDNAHGALGHNIILTSRYAAQYASTIALPEEATFFVVGNEAATVIKQHGLGTVAYIASDASDLLHFIKDYAKKAPASPSFHYLRGQYISQDIAQRLAAQQLRVDESIVYQIKAVDEVAQNLQQYVANAQQPLICPLLSRRTAAVIGELIFAVKNPAVDRYAVALSEAIIAEVTGYDWAGNLVAKKADINSLASACMKLFDSISNH